MLIVISGPSGSGKTTIVQEMLNTFPDIQFSVSATTRPQRPKEQNGVDYFFLTQDEFKLKIDQGDLIEWEEIYGNYYGTLRSFVDKELTNGKDVLFDIDVKGALSIRKKYPNHSTLIFIKPPDFDTLKKRLLHRATDNEDIINRRLERTKMEIDMSEMFDHVIVNDEITLATTRVADIISSAVRNAN